MDCDKASDKMGEKIPSKRELTQWIIENSLKTYPNHSEFGIGYNYYKTKHPPEWCGNTSLLKAYGKSSANTSWNELVSELTGLRCPSNLEANQLRRGKRNRNGYRYNYNAVRVKRSDVPLLAETRNNPGL